ncbi:MAG: biotin--[acetyl-CoA-carboxylase] ligase [Anaerolineae bacterium]
MFSFDSNALAARLNTSLLGHPLTYLDSVASTQAVVRTAALAGAAEGLAVMAGQQTAGKGRAGRSWWSPPSGGLYLSLLLRPKLPGDLVAWAIMALSLGAADAIEQVCGLHVEIKWPNDLQYQGRKLAGVLAEGAFTGQRLDYVIAGIGLNVAVDFSSQPDLAQERRQPAPGRGPSGGPGRAAGRAAGTGRDPLPPDAERPQSVGGLAGAAAHLGPSRARAAGQRPHADRRCQRGAARRRPAHRPGRGRQRSGLGQRCDPAPAGMNQGLP